MNIPNRLTILRIILIPVYLFFLLVDIGRSHFIIATAVFIITAITDNLDGRYARKHKMVTDFGKFLDPIADKLLVLSAMIGFVKLDLMPAWACIIIMAREILVSGFRLICAGKGKVVQASFLGKIKTALQMIFIIITTFNFSYYFMENAPGFCNVVEIIRQILMYAVILVTIGSLVDYFYKNRQLIPFDDI